MFPNYYNQSQMYSEPTTPDPTDLVSQINEQSEDINLLKYEVDILEQTKSELMEKYRELITQKNTLDVDIGLAKSAVRMLQYQIKEQRQKLNLQNFEKSQLEAIAILGNRVIQLQQQIQALQNPVQPQQSMQYQLNQNGLIQPIQGSFQVIQKMLPVTTGFQSNIIQISDSEDDMDQPSGSVTNSYEQLPGTEMLQIYTDSSHLYNDTPTQKL